MPAKTRKAKTKAKVNETAKKAEGTKPANNPEGSEMVQKWFHSKDSSKYDFGEKMVSYEVEMFTKYSEENEDLSFPLNDFLDAHLLLRFATSTGVQVPEEIISDITNMASKLGTSSPTVEEITKFRLANQKLSALMDPVSAYTIRNCLDSYGRKTKYTRAKRSVARLLSLQLWFFTWLALLLILFTEIGHEYLLDWYPLDDESDGEGRLVFYYRLFYVLDHLVPFAYGLLGACAFLLRASHRYMAAFTFKKVRLPEYYNRLLLGLIAGGTIQLFIQQIAADDGTVIYLSGAALGFLAGYNTDFLFHALERLSEAILPKVSIETMARKKDKLVPTPASPKELGDLLLKATDQKDKEAIRKMMDKLGG